ncbi:hypothetical protein E7T06_17750 [Deinococcus sp. Arct2-2]|uniref:hypothetical protein n=1 Tax=Deinococcus sp. Arct2-2 TaxID=2568653 RepID=UPI0010A33216|nr:hypothetical protein [Deinococcus sp. Arct2-2]THF68178.1 hypothetical protein E7T06_17750 [Deinococcus sp. Arct2-2]
MNDFPHPPLPEHTVYLLRIWHELDGSKVVWRASVLLPYGTQRRYFATPDALLEFLNAQVRDPEPE